MNQSSIAYGFLANDLLSVVVTELNSTSATLNQYLYQFLMQEISHLFLDRLLDRPLAGRDCEVSFETMRQRPMKIRIPNTVIAGISPYAISGLISSVSQKYDITWRRARNLNL